MNLLDVFQDAETRVRFPEGSVIISEGSTGNNMYVVLQGQVSISLRGRELAIAGPGDIVGEMALIDSEIRSATVTAKTDCLLASIDQASFMSLLRHVPEFKFHVMEVLGARLQKTYEMIEDE